MTLERDRPPTGFFDVRMRGFQQRAEVAEVVALIDRSIRPLPAERAEVLSAAGRVLTEGVVSPRPVPPFDRAAMDGYALRAEDTFGATAYNPLTLTIVGEALPGRPFAGDVTTGQAVRIMTGAPVPAGADAVLPAEMAEESAGAVRVVEAVPPGRHIGRIGEDVGAGVEVLPAGRRLRPQDVGLLASIGIASVAVVRRPHVAIVVTGNELVPAGTEPGPNRIVDSNSVVLRALVERDGGIALPTQHLPDRPELIREALTRSDADVILVSGGSSVGREDHAPRLLAELGTLAVHGVALRPASPTGLGFIGERPVFLLPGNPVSCLCAYDLFAGRAIQLLGGLAAGLPYATARLPLAAKVVSAVGRVDYVRVRIIPAGVEPTAVSGASMLSTTVIADGFLLVDRDREGYPPGELVNVYLYDPPASAWPE